jgi:hypothetical protein
LSACLSVCLSVLQSYPGCCVAWLVLDRERGLRIGLGFGLLVTDIECVCVCVSLVGVVEVGSRCLMSVTNE